MNPIVNRERTKIDGTDKKFIVFRPVRLLLPVVEPQFERKSSPSPSMFELLILPLANMAIIGLIRFDEKSNADGEAYFQRVPTAIFCGTVIFGGLGMGNGEWGKSVLFPVPYFAFPTSRPTLP
jgi:hypothetical protein